MSSKARFNFFVDDRNRFLVVRPIGPLSGPDLAAHVIEAYRNIEAPWTFNRIVDLRRHTSYFTKADRGLIASAWSELTAGVKYHAHVAMVVREAYEKVRLPELCEQFPNETICYFLNYHEAVGWILAADQAKYLSGLSELFISPVDSDAIIIE